MSMKGLFTPRNPHKYRGDPNKIVWRSSWECTVFSRLDTNPDIVWWQSEEVIVPYTDPFTGSYRRYFPDVVYGKRDQNGNVTVYMVEIKPYSQTMPPQVQQKKTKRYLNEVHTWGINNSKWIAARKFCERRGWQFHVITERELKTF